MAAGRRLLCGVALAVLAPWAAQSDPPPASPLSDLAEGFAEPFPAPSALGQDLSAILDAIAGEADALRAGWGDLDLDALLPAAQEPLADDLAEGRGFADAAAEILREDLARRGAAVPLVEGPRYLVFASEAMPSGERAGLAAVVEARGDMAVVFRGIAPGERLEEAAARLAEAGGPFVIDPRPFREHDVRVVPAILDQETGLLVYGVIDPALLEGRAHGDRLGPVTAVSEPDMAEMMQARAARIDWIARREAALRRYWSHAPMEPLSPALAPRRRQIDARFTLAEDFTLPDGVVAARAGDVIDPMAARPFTLALIVFDGASPAELPVVEAAIAEAAEDGWRPVLIASRIDRLEGWEGLGRLQERLGAAVYMLTPELRERFDLRRTVSVVTGEGGWFHIDERPAGAIGLQEAAR